MIANAGRHDALALSKPSRDFQAGIAADPCLPGCVAEGQRARQFAGQVIGEAGYCRVSRPRAWLEVEKIADGFDKRHGGRKLAAIS